MPAERVDFPNASGQMLAALLDRPDRAPAAYALFAHCFTCGKDILAAKRIAERLTAHGIAVLRFDFTGLGASEGEFANTTFSSNVADLVAAAEEPGDMRRIERRGNGHDGACVGNPMRGGEHRGATEAVTDQNGRHAHCRPQMIGGGDQIVDV